MPKKWMWRGKEVDPPDHVTKSEVQEMIDDAIRKHNRNAGIISMCVGSLFSHFSLKVFLD